MHYLTNTSTLWKNADLPTWTTCSRCTVHRKNKSFPQQPDCTSPYCLCYSANKVLFFAVIIKAAWYNWRNDKNLDNLLKWRKVRREADIFVKLRSIQLQSHAFFFQFSLNSEKFTNLKRGKICLKNPKKPLTFNISLWKYFHTIFFFEYWKKSVFWVTRWHAYNYATCTTEMEIW